MNPIRSIKLILLAAALHSSSIAARTEIPPGQFDIAANALSAPVAARSPIYRSTDFGRTWSPLSAGFPAEAGVVALGRRGSQLLAATDNDGLFLSDERGEKWNSIGHGLPDRKITAVHATDDTIIAGVFRHGLYATRDNGESWASLNDNLPNLNIRAILASPDGLLVATDAGIFKSVKGSRSWKTVFSECQIVSLNPGHGKIVAGGVKGVLLSEDQGEHWRWIHQAGAAHTTALLDRKIVVMNISGDLFISNDWGQTWQSADYSPRQGSYVYNTVALGQHLVASNNYGTHQSSDGGATWQHLHDSEDRYAFLGLIAIGQTLYGGASPWAERRPRRDFSQFP